MKVHGILDQVWIDTPDISYYCEIDYCEGKYMFSKNGPVYPIIVRYEANLPIGKRYFSKHIKLITCEECLKLLSIKDILK